jgi:serine/threonine protein kinase
MNQSVLATKASRQAHFFAHGEKLQERYLIGRQLGAGGMGAVYEAVDERLQVTVAVKETFAVDARLRRQFEQEARLLAQLNHPALPRVSDYFTEDGRAFLVMQFIAGDDLAQIIAAQPGPFPRAQVIAWADQLLDALIYLHTQKRQIVHRDIKPHNLKLTANGQIALLDFGLAKAHQSDQTTTQSSHSIFGYTRRYSPLEQIQDQGTSPQSDIYALGATLYHLLTGIKPPDALARATALANSNEDPLQSADNIQPLVGPELSLVLSKAMALNANDRFVTALEFREALRHLGRVGPASSPIVTVPHGVKSRLLTAQSRNDPFDGYSILRPEEDFLRISKRKHGPALFAAGAAVVLIALTIAYPGKAINSVAGKMEQVVPSAAKSATDAASLRQAKTENALAKSSVAKNASSGSSGEMNHQNAGPKRPANANSRAPRLGPVKPPPMAIAP